MKIQPYLHLKDNCEEAFRFYEKALGGQIVMLSRFRDAPPAEGGHGEEGMEGMEGMADKVMHVRLAVGDQVLMGSDTPPKFPHNGIQGCTIALGYDTGAEAEEAFHALSEGAQEVSMPIGETFWAERFGMFTDRFGVAWMVNGGEKKGP